MEIDSTSIAMLITLLILVVLSAYFSATETAFTSLNRIRLKTRADNGSRRAAKTLALAEEYDKLLSTILIGNNIVNITATTVSTVLCTRWFHQYGPTVATVALTIIILVFGEITPKSMSKERPEDFAMFAQPLLRLFMVVFTPLNFLFSQWKKLMSRVFRAKGDDGITEEELVGMVDQAQTEGGLDEHESDLIRNAIEFNNLEVSEILTPRVDLTAADEESTMEELAALEAQRPAIKHAIAEARDKGDLSENAEYDAAKEAQGLLEMKIAKLKELVATARIIDDSKLNTDEVQLLNTVTIKNVATGMTMTYTIVTENESNLREHKIASSTPIAQGLLGHKVGDTVQIKAPAGIMNFEIVKIEI